MSRSLLPILLLVGCAYDLDALRGQGALDAGDTDPIDAEVPVDAMPIDVYVPDAFAEDARPIRPDAPPDSPPDAPPDAPMCPIAPSTWTVLPAAACASFDLLELSFTMQPDCDVEQHWVVACPTGPDETGYVPSEWNGTTAPSRTYGWCGSSIACAFSRSGDTLTMTCADGCEQTFGIEP